MPSTVRPAGYKNFGRTTSTVLDIVRNDKTEATSGVHPNETDTAGLSFVLRIYFTIPFEAQKRVIDRVLFRLEIRQRGFYIDREL